MLERSSGIVVAVLAFAFAAPSQAQNFRFKNVTAEAGLTYPLAPHTPGASVGDYDGDGWLDVCFAGGVDRRPQIFRNNGAEIAAGADVRSFSNVSHMVMTADAQPSSLAVFADLDNDSDQDLVSVRRFPTDGYDEGNHDDTGIQLYVQKNGRFHPVDADPELGRSHNRLGGLALADTDGDSDLDIVFVHNGGGVGQGGPGFFLRNDGLARVVDASASFGADIGTQRRYFSVLLADFNGDGWPDLHAAVDFHSDWHCWNQGGVFTDVTLQVGTTNQGSDMGLAIGDIENDGDMDIFSTNIGEGILYVNDGTGHFTEEGAQRGCGSWGPGAPIGWGAVFSDLDGDMDQDLVFVAYGEAQGKLFENDGNGYFTDATEGSFLRLRAHSLIDFDYDRDGDLDLLVTRSGEGNYPYLFENVSPALEDRHWLTVRTVGTVSNRDGIGAKVEVVAGGVTQTRQVLSGYSFKSGPPKQVHFGLADNAEIDVLRVTWPSGTVQTLNDVEADQHLVVVEPAP